MNPIRNLVPILLLAFAAGCGGGASKQASDPVVQPTGLSSGTHTLGLSVAAPNGGLVPISGISISVLLPSGVSVTTGSGDPGVIPDTALSAGSAVTGAPLLSGTYSSSTRLARLVYADTPLSTWSGEYLKLKITVLSGATVSASDILALNGILPAYKVVGFDPGTHSTVSLTAQAATTLKVLD